jgi:hypothetical protein
MKIFARYEKGLTIYRLPKTISDGGRTIMTKPQTREYPFRANEFMSQISYNLQRGSSTKLKSITTKERNNPIDAIEILNGRATIYFYEKDNFEDGKIKEIRLDHNDPMVVGIPINSYIYNIVAEQSNTIIQIKRNFRKFVTTHL